MVSVKQENRWRKHLHDEAMNAERKRHAALCIGLKRAPRAPLPHPRQAPQGRAELINAIATTNGPPLCGLFSFQWHEHSAHGVLS